MIFQCIGSDVYCLALVKAAENVGTGILMVVVMVLFGVFIYKVIKYL